ncbi:Phosphate transport system permease protein PstA [bioreactor metagenome]|uniref:Phosphate transport system permease protein PstA n=1 Tax=bioreactor metagenome TaxID=1076179 RepID=A0A644Z400_9ZZZZ|nr:phosphate ABC transporter permease PstA [Erysipelotrichaceae bacterium]
MPSLPLKTHKTDLTTVILNILVKLAVIITTLILSFIILYIFVKGIPYLKPSLFALEYNSENVSLFPALVNTVTMTFITLLVSAPLGIASAIYLVEYANKNSRIVNLIRITTETLSGIPSIVYGLFGYLFFLNYIGWKFSIIAGALTLAIMVLPLIIRTTEEALIAVPIEYRMGSYGLGAGKLRTIFKIVLPSSISGVLAGIILAIGRIVGETAALIFTAGTVAQIPDSIFSSGRTLAIHMYALNNEGLYVNESYATAVVLLIVVIFINALSTFIAKKFKRG